ncbi:MAG: EAL domain-containing protein [Rhodanobacter sp.]
MEKTAPGVAGAEYQAIINASLDAIFILDPNGCILDVNLQAVARYGYSADELRHINVSQLAAPEIRGKVSKRRDGLLHSTTIFESIHQHRDGSLLAVEVYSQPFASQGEPLILLSVRDIGERNRLRLKLEEKEHFLARILDAEPGAVYIFDLAERRNVYVNRQLFTEFGHASEQSEFIGTETVPRFHPDDLRLIEEHHQAWQHAVGGETRTLEYRIRDGDGSLHWLVSRETPFFRDASGQISQILGIASDVTLRKRAEILMDRQKQLLEMIATGTPLSETLTALVRSIEEQSPGMLGSVLLLDEDGVHIRHGAASDLPVEFVKAIDGQPIGPSAGSCGTAAFRREAVYVEDLRTDPLWANYRAEAMRWGLVAAWSQPILDRRGQVLGTFAMYFRHPALPAAEHLRLMVAAVHVASIAISRHRERTALRDKEACLEKAQQVAHLGFIEWRRGANRVFCSEEVYRICGLVRQTEFMALDMVMRMVHPDDLARVQENLEMAIGGRGEYDITHRIVRPDGHVIWVHAQAELIRDAATDSDALLCTMVDITTHKTAEDSLQRMTRLYAARSRCNQAIVRSASEEELFSQICRDAVEFGGMKMAWIGVVDEAAGLVRQASSFGAGMSYLTLLEIPLVGDDPRGWGPVGTSIRQDQPFWCQDFKQDPATAPWHESGALKDWNAIASIPLHRKRAVFGAFVVYSDRRNAFDEAGRNLLVEMARDISYALDRFSNETERLQSEQKLRLSEQHLRTVIETEPECVKLIGRTGELIEMNAAGLAMFELDSVEQVTKSFLSSFVLPEHREPFRNLHERVMKGESATLAFEIVGLKGTRRWLETHAAPMRDANGDVVSLLSISRDITERKSSEARIQYLANFDALTGLPNRNLLADHLQYAISLAKRSHGSLAVMFIDLDRFKVINDTMGHSSGDAILVEVGARLKKVLRESDTASRLGGDEFILVLPDSDARLAVHVADKVLEAISRPYQIGPFNLVVQASIGIAIYPDDGDDLESLSRSADTAMYRVKEEGRNGYRFFTAEMQERATRHMLLLNEMHRALSQNQFEVHYQPQLSLDDGRVVGLEALLRWNHPGLGSISPVEFIPVAEDCGLILPIGEWVMRTAVHELKRLMDCGYPMMAIAVNLSAVQFRHKSLVDMIDNILTEADVPAQCLELELTESVAMSDPQSAVAVMDRLHERGVRLSIDDFGTGYSSLNYLKKFRVFKVKIDQSFVQDVSSDKEDRAIVAAIISMSSRLGLRTIAEGVETVEQLAFLREQGCDEAQGYYFSKALPSAQIEAFLSARLTTTGSGAPR